jgi:hypothetical protein
LDWKVIEAIFIILFIKIPAWLFKHRIVLFGILALIAGIFIWRSCACQPNPSGQTPEQTKQEQLAPKIKLAPYVLATPSRYYYVATYTQDSKTQVTLTKWWEWGNDRWIPRTIPLVVSKQVYGDYRLYKREK